MEGKAREVGEVWPSILFSWSNHNHHHSHSHLLPKLLFSYYYLKINKSLFWSLIQCLLRYWHAMQILLYNGPALSLLLFIASSILAAAGAASPRESQKTITSFVCVSEWGNPKNISSWVCKKYFLAVFSFSLHYPVLRRWALACLGLAFGNYS